jgi:hypothetical protein
MSSDHITAITEEFEPISLDELNERAALQTRTDNKYFVAWPVFVVFAEALHSTHLILSIDRQRAFRYDTQYFDTIDLASYWAHIQARRKRFKCRSRRYLDSGLCFFELKLKGGRGETIKYKMAYDETKWDLVTPEAATFLHDRLHADYGMLFTESLRPTLRTHYQRATLTARAFPERITCDFNLAFATAGNCEGLMAPEYVLVETKSERGRGAADQLLWKLGVRPSGGSKYCLGLSLVQPELRSNPFLQVRRRYFIRKGEQQFAPPPVRAVFSVPDPASTGDCASVPLVLPGPEAVGY